MPTPTKWLVGARLQFQFYLLAGELASGRYSVWNARMRFVLLVFCWVFRCERVKGLTEDGGAKIKYMIG